MPTPDDPGLGLKKKEIEFVKIYAETGSRAVAARRSGYSRSYADDLMRKPKISAAVLFESQRLMVMGAPIAVRTILRLATSAASEKVQFDAAKFLIEQNLGKALERISLEVAMPQEERELLDRIGELARELGLRTIDVTPEEVIEATDGLGGKAAFHQTAGPDAQTITLAPIGEALGAPKSDD
jgi:hypothetical protein